MLKCKISSLASVCGILYDARRGGCVQGSGAQRFAGLRSNRSLIILNIVLGNLEPAVDYSLH